MNLVLILKIFLIDITYINILKYILYMEYDRKF